MEKVKKEKSKTRKIIEWVATGIFVGLITFAAVVLITTKVQRKNSSNPNEPARFGNIFFPILVESGSMEPAYPQNSAIFIEPTSGDAIYQSYLNGQCWDITFDDYYYGSLSIEEEAYLATIGKTDRTTIYSPMRTMTHRIIYATVDNSKEYGQGKYRFFVEGINRAAASAHSAEDQYQAFTENEVYGKVVGCSVAVGWIFTAAESPWGLIVLLIIPSLYMVISSIIDVAKAYKEEDMEEAGTSQNNVINLSEEDKERLKQEMLDEILKGKDKDKEK